MESLSEAVSVKEDDSDDDGVNDVYDDDGVTLALSSALDNISSSSIESDDKLHECESLLEQLLLLLMVSEHRSSTSVEIDFVMRESNARCDLSPIPSVCTFLLPATAGKQTPSGTRLLSFAEHWEACSLDGTCSLALQVSGGIAKNLSASFVRLATDGVACRLGNSGTWGILGALWPISARILTSSSITREKNFLLPLLPQLLLLLLPGNDGVSHFSSSVPPKSGVQRRPHDEAGVVAALERARGCGGALCKWRSRIPTSHVRILHFLSISFTSCVGSATTPSLPRVTSLAGLFDHDGASHDCLRVLVAFG